MRLRIQLSKHEHTYVAADASGQRIAGPACAHWGAAVGEAACSNCHAKTTPVHACAIHGNATLKTSKNKAIAACSNCLKAVERVGPIPREAKIRIPAPPPAPEVIDLITSETPAGKATPCRGLGDAITWAWISEGCAKPLTFAATGGIREMLELFGQRTIQERIGASPSPGYALETKEHFRRSRTEAWCEGLGIVSTPRRPSCGVTPTMMPLRVAIAPQCAWKARTWPEEWFQQVADRLTAYGCEIVWATTEPGLTFLELAKQIARCSLLIGNDSMPAHMAATLGIPCVVLFGLTTAAVMSHYGDLIESVQAGTNIERITVEQVMRAAWKRLAAPITLQNWEPWIVDYVPSGGRFALDVGGNTGQWARHLCQRFAKVMTLEPHAELATVIESYGLPNLTVLRKAAWKEDTELDFAKRGNNADVGWSAIVAQDVHRAQPAEVVRVPCVAIDSLGLPACDFIKIDIEGAEVEAIQGAARTIEIHKPQLVVECHGAAQLAKIREWLEQIGYNVSVIHGPGYAPGSEGWKNHVWLAAKYYR